MLNSPPKQPQQAELLLIAAAVGASATLAAAAAFLAAPLHSSAFLPLSRVSCRRFFPMSALPISLAARIAGDADEMTSLLHADALDRPQNEWSSFLSSDKTKNSNSDPIEHDQHDKDITNAAEHALHDFGTAARATLSTLPLGLIRRLVGKLFEVREIESVVCILSNFKFADAAAETFFHFAIVSCSRIIIAVADRV